MRHGQVCLLSDVYTAPPSSLAYAPVSGFIRSRFRPIGGTCNALRTEKNLRSPDDCRQYGWVLSPPFYLRCARKERQVILASSGDLPAFNHDGDATTGEFASRGSTICLSLKLARSRDRTPAACYYFSEAFCMRGLRVLRARTRLKWGYVQANSPRRCLVKWSVLRFWGVRVRVPGREYLQHCTTRFLEIQST